MKFKEIFNHVEHRPYPLPKKFWIMKQIWLDLLFMHWRVDPKVLREKIPSKFELDLYNKEAWIGIVPFRMSGIRPRFLTTFPYLSAFPELNVRTYIKYKGKSGVWFFSLDAGNSIAVKIARKFFYLPYYYANMNTLRNYDEVLYSSQRNDPLSKNGKLKMKYSAIGEEYYSKQGSLEHWLTERYSLFTWDGKSQYFCGDIHHLPWGLRKASAEIEINEMGKVHGIELPEEKPILHFVDKLEVAIYPLEKLK